MKFWDGIHMATHNLWSRKGRTLLNLLGVVISCIMLAMTMAGARGVREGVFDIMNASEQTKRFMIFQSYNRNLEVPDDAIEVPEGLSAERRKRIVERLEASWRSRNAKLIRLNQEVMDQLRSVEKMDAVVWQSPLRCQFVWQDEAAEREGSKYSKPVSGSLIGIDSSDGRIDARLVTGQTVSRDDSEGVLIDEYTAYNMGYRTDAELETVIGKRVQIRCTLGRVSKTPFKANAPSFEVLEEFAGLVDQKLFDSLKRVAHQIDKTDLSEQEKQSIRAAFDLKDPTSGNIANKKNELETSHLAPDIEIDSNNNKILIKDVIVRGVLRQPEDEELFDFLQFTGRGSVANVYIDHLMSESIQSRKDGFNGFYNVAGSVSEVSDLRQVVDDVEAIGLRTRSAVGIVEKLEKEVGKVKLAVGALGLLILLVAAIGICNTMIIAVLERTPEFGIMKSLGAEDRQVLSLVLFEGLVTGVLGAAIAILISFGVAQVASEFARTWIEEKLRGSFDQPVFRFHVFDGLIVFLISAVMCVLACLIPAWRAAKLDPVAAMKRV